MNRMLTILLLVCVSLAGCGKPKAPAVPNVSIFQSMDCVQPFVARTDSLSSVSLKLLTVEYNIPKGQHPMDTITLVLRESEGKDVATATRTLVQGTNGWIVIPFRSEVTLVPEQEYTLHVHDGRNGWFGWEYAEVPDGKGSFGAPESGHRVEIRYKLTPE